MNQDLISQITDGKDISSLHLVDEIDNDKEKTEDTDQKEGDEGNDGGKDSKKDGKTPDATKSTVNDLLKNIIGGDNKDDKGEDGDEGDTTEDDKDDKSKETKNSVIATLREDYGYVGDDYDEFFKDVDVNDNSVEGIKKFNERRDELVAIEAINSKPEIADLYTHLESGKSVASWKEKMAIVDYSKIVLSEDKPEDLEKIIKEDLERKGVKARVITATIDDLKDNKELFTEAKAIHEATVNALKAENQKKQLAEQQVAQQEKQNFVQVQKRIHSIIDAGKINGLTIPQNERNEFKNLVLSSKRDEMYEKLTEEQSLFLDFLALKLVKGKQLNLNGNNSQKTTIVTKKTSPMKSGEADNEEDSNKYIGLEGLRKLKNNAN